MLAIRMQRTGRKGHAEFRIVVQDAHVTPTSGKIVARIGNYNPHNKAVVLDKEKVAFYLKNGAQPSPRVVRLLQAEKVALPEWVAIPSTDKKRSIKHVEKLRRNQPKEVPAEPVEQEAPAETPAETATEESAAPEAADTTAEESVAEEAKAEA